MLKKCLRAIFIKRNQLAYLGLIFVPMLIYAHGDKHAVEISQYQRFANKNALERINKNYKQSIKPIFRQKCMNCHSDSTKYPWYYRLPVAKRFIDSDIKEARKHLDFSNDFPFQGHGTPKKDLEGFRKVIAEDSMPPLKYRMMHWGSKLTKPEKETILVWIKSSLNRLKK